MPARRGPGWALGIIAAIVALSALSDWAQVISTVARGEGEPPLLLVLHVLSGTVAVAAAIASWRRDRRAPALLLAWGLAITVLRLAVPYAVGLDGAAARGIHVSAAGVLAVASLMAWVARRALGVPDTR